MYFWFNWIGISKIKEVSIQLRVEKNLILQNKLFINMFNNQLISTKRFIRFL